MLEAPCKNCPKKGCGSFHDICSDYQEYRKEWEKERESQKIAEKLRSDLSAIEAERKYRYRKSTHSKQR